MTQRVLWEIGLTYYDVLRVYAMVKSHRLPEVLAWLMENRSVRLEPDEAHAMVAEIDRASEQCGVFVLDNKFDAQPFMHGELPNVVLAAMDGVYFDINNMTLMVNTAKGKFLDPNLSDEDRSKELRKIRWRVIASSTCRGKTADGKPCQARVVTRLGAAAQAIERYGLIEQGSVYELPTLCPDCRDVQNAIRREKTATLPPKRKGGLATIADQQAWKAAANAKKRQEIDAQEQQEREERQRQHQYHVQQQTEVSDVDQSAALALPLDEEEAGL